MPEAWSNVSPIAGQGGSAQTCAGFRPRQSPGRCYEVVSSATSAAFPGKKVVWEPEALSGALCHHTPLGSVSSGRWKLATEAVGLLHTRRPSVPLGSCGARC